VKPFLLAIGAGVALSGFWIAVQPQSVIASITFVVAVGIGATVSLYLWMTG
jgi:hypothetical protein